MDSREQRKQEKFWNQLIRIIGRESVVPVVGEDILVLDAQNNTMLYDEIARKYADYAEIEISPGHAFTLSATVRSHPEFNTNPHDISQEIGEEFEELAPEIPIPIKKLASITGFNLFVTTTFDNLLERAINQIRFNGQAKTKVIAYSPKRIPTEEETTLALTSGMPVIFQIFGSYKNPLNFALTEGDKLEYIHALHSSEYGPKAMLNELYSRPLLLIGNRFPDWLTRTFLRLTRQTPLDNKEVPKQYLADFETSNPALSYFLESFTANTEVIRSHSPVEFIISLADKWQEKNTVPDSGAQDKSILIQDREALRKPPPPGAVFISYAATDINGLESKDKETALIIRNALIEQGIEAWLDLDELKSGDDYSKKIKRSIATCSLFIPLVSEITNARENGFFRREWYWASERLIDFTGANRQFIFPVALGDIDPYEAQVPEEFTRFQFQKLGHCNSVTEIDKGFIQAIKRVYLTQTR